MRLISQSKNIDIPYEKTSIFHAMCNVMAIYDGKEYLLGKYSSMEKAYKVMEMMRNKYGEYYFTQGGEMLTRDIYIQPFGIIPPKVFIFPKDEEVEM